MKKIMRYLSLVTVLIVSSSMYGAEPQVQQTAPDYGDIIDTFSGHRIGHHVQPFMDHVRLIELSQEGEPSDHVPYRFFGVHEHDQLKVNFGQLKQKITALMGISRKQSIQIIGDSGKFSVEGTHKARQFLRNAMDHAPLVEYGFTGYRNPEGSELDINSFVNEYADERHDIAQRVLANIVGHTSVAIKKWGTYGSPRIRHFVVVYNDCGMHQEPEYRDGKKVSGFTTFGNDVTISDYLLQAQDGDRFICLEGGVQSLLQVINALQQEIPVTLIYNLRTSEKEKLFSAARYLSRVCAACKHNPDLSPEKVKAIFDEYEKTLQSIWDPNKADYKTKKELFDVAMSRFIQEQLYRKIPALCTFIDAHDLAE